jgi:hypothetical protein
MTDGLQGSGAVTSSGKLWTIMATECAHEKIGTKIGNDENCNSNVSYGKLTRDFYGSTNMCCGLEH